jgi:predicted RNA-binding Zn-ribbon protein involved in translation (DUF1610 family)
MGTAPEERHTERCPNCGVENGLVSYGQHPIYGPDGQQQSDLQVAVYVCRNCGHVKLEQTTQP